MQLEFFDVNTFIGRPMNRIFKPAQNGEALVAEMKTNNITKAITYHIFQYEGSPEKGNSMLAEEISKHPELYGCWTILPPQTEEVIKDDFFKKMKENKIVALNAFPEWHRYILDKVSFGEFFEHLIERKIPLLLTMGRSCITWESLYNFMKDFPLLTCILCDIGIWGVDRFTFPLLEKFPNFYLETSLLSLEEGGLESVVKRFGSQRLIFGTGFPVRYQKAAILQIIHADISDSDKINIASKNLEQILREEKL